MKLDELLEQEKQLDKGQECILTPTEPRVRNLIAEAITRYGLMNINQFMTEDDVYPYLPGYTMSIKISRTLVYVKDAKGLAKPDLKDDAEQVDDQKDDDLDDSNHDLDDAENEEQM